MKPTSYVTEKKRERKKTLSTHFEISVDDFPFLIYHWFTIYFFSALSVWSTLHLCKLLSLFYLTYGITNVQKPINWTFFLLSDLSKLKITLQSLFHCIYVDIIYIYFIHCSRLSFSSSDTTVCPTFMLSTHIHCVVI